MKRYFIFALCSIVAYISIAQVLHSSDDGNILRGKLSFDIEAYESSLDQLSLASETETSLIMRANALFSRGDFRQASEEYKRFISKYPSSASKVYAKFGIANCLLALGESSEALKAFNDIDPNALIPAYQGLYYYHSAIAKKSLNMPEAKADFTKASSYPKVGAKARFYLGQIEYENKNYPTSLGYFKPLEGLAGQPFDAIPMYIAEINYAQGNYTEAYTRAKSICTSDTQYDKTEMLRIAGEAAFRLNNTSESKVYLQKYLETATNPEASALYYLGLIEFNEEKYSDAIEHLQPATTASDPILAQSALLYSGLALTKNDNTTAAIFFFERALQITDGDFSTRETALYNYAVAKLSGASVPFSSASSTFEEYLNSYPDGKYADNVRRYLAEGYLAEKDYVNALNAAEGIITPSQSDIATKQNIIYGYAFTLSNNGSPKEAISILNKGRNISSSTSIDNEIILLYARAYAATENYSEAIKYFNEYLRKKNPTNKDIALYGLGYSKFTTKDFSGAENAFSQITNSKKLSSSARADVFNRLADIAYYSSDFATAQQRYAQAKSIDASAAEYASFNEARMMGYQKNYSEELAALKNFRKNKTYSSLMPDVLLETAQTYINLGQNSEAVNTYRTLIDEYPSTTQGRQGRLQLAMTLLDMNQTDDALDEYTEIIKLYPSSSEAAQASTLLKNILTREGRVDEYLNFMASVDNAPAMTADESEALEFESAMNAFKRGNTSKLIQFISTYPNSAKTPKALASLMNSQIEAGNMAEATKYASEIAERYPDSSEAESALKILAQTNYANGEVPTALAYWKKLEEKASSPSMLLEARLGVMRCAVDMGESSLAENYATKISKSEDNNSAAYIESIFTLGWAKDDQELTSEAISIWGTIADKTNDINGTKAAVHQAQALFDNGDIDNAAKAIQKFNSSGTPYKYWLARGFILLSDIYTAQGKTLEAQEYLKALRENYPGAEPDILQRIQTRLDK